MAWAATAPCLPRARPIDPIAHRHHSPQPTQPRQFKFVEYPPEDKEDVLVGQSVQRKRGGGGSGEAGGSK